MCCWRALHTLYLLAQPLPELAGHQLLPLVQRVFPLPHKLIDALGYFVRSGFRQLSWTDLAH
jgi:hypothetical protein